MTLNRAPSGTVTVDYATTDGTATAGSDYTATSGTLTFAAGETEKTVSVPVLDDAHDEGSETLTLTLSNASGAHIEDGTATGTINNSDHMPKAWMVRFGRTVGSQVVDALGQRFLKAPRPRTSPSAASPLTGAPGAVPEAPVRRPVRAARLGDASAERSVGAEPHGERPPAQAAPSISHREAGKVQAPRTRHGDGSRPAGSPPRSTT